MTGIVSLSPHTLWKTRESLHWSNVGCANHSFHINHDSFPCTLQQVGLEVVQAELTTHLILPFQRLSRFGKSSTADKNTKEDKSVLLFEDCPPIYDSSCLLPLRYSKEVRFRGTLSEVWGKSLTGAVTNQYGSPQKSGPRNIHKAWLRQLPSPAVSSDCAIWHEGKNVPHKQSLQSGSRIAPIIFWLVDWTSL